MSGRVWSVIGWAAAAVRDQAGSVVSRERQA
jgi:hypothetical protein